MTMNDRKISEEFVEFVSASEMAPPAKIKDAVLARIHRDLNPTNQGVFLKMLGIHAVVSLFSLSICSQFGIRVLSITMRWIR